tara:strand:+ start:748 stop:1164 length:417 start_codon:yes stop_codon:yes gene_type:complete
LVNKKLSDSDLMLIFKKQESILKIILDLSQLQLAENDSLGLDELLKKKDTCIEELKKLDPILEKWYLENKRPLKPIEQNIEKNILDLMENILISENDFEKLLGQEKNAVSLQISEISNQMQYRKKKGHQKIAIKRMKT